MVPRALACGGARLGAIPPSAGSDQGRRDGGRDGARSGHGSPPGRGCGVRRGGGRARGAGDERGDAGAKFRVGGEHTVVPGLVLAGRRDERGEAAQERDPFEHELGLAGEPGPGQAVSDLAIRLMLSRPGNPRPRATASKPRSSVLCSLTI